MMPSPLVKEAKATMPTTGLMQSTPGDQATHTMALATTILLSTTSWPAEASVSCPSPPPKIPILLLQLKPHNVICAAYNYTSKQPGNIILNNLVFDRQDGYRPIDPLDQHKKAEYTYQIISEIELSGRFVTPVGSDSYTLADEHTKKSSVVLTKLGGPIIM